MSRRILTAIIIVAVIVVAGFGLPLGVAVNRLYRNEEVVRLEREATRAGAQVPADFLTSGDPVELRRSDSRVTVGLYSPVGHRILGAGPESGGEQVIAAATGRIAESDEGALVVAVPLTSDERVFAVVRAEQPGAVIAARVRRAWLLMIGLGGLMVAIAGVIGLALARRIAKPVGDLAEASSRLGRGDFTVRAARSGIPELDAVADSLGATAETLGRLIDRERSFSVDASHQLRTPLTGLRLHLETALSSQRVDATNAMTVALGEVDRLERTIEDLLMLARDLQASDGPVILADALEAVEGAWRGRLAASGRPLRIRADPAAAVAMASRRAVDQILEVLVGNAFQHGLGVVRVTASSVAGGVAIDVGDEGPGIAGDRAAIFERRSSHNTGHGIGLALARSLAEAEGGRLLLVESEAGTTFRVILRAADGP
jgi:signal transduction histidine kinase